jgi:hypothetical protein
MPTRLMVDWGPETLAQENQRRLGVPGVFGANHCLQRREI